MTIGDKIKYFRNRIGITQERLGKLTGIHPVSIRRYEANKVIPQSAQIDKIAEVLAVSPNAFYELNNSEKKVSLETYGDFVGLLIMLCKNGIVSMVGDRDENGTLKVESVSFEVNPLIGQFFSEDTSKRIYLNDKYIIEDLVKWEKVTNDYEKLLDKYGNTSDKNEKKQLAQLKIMIEKIEMELQRSRVLLDRKNGISVKIPPDYFGSD